MSQRKYPVGLLCCKSIHVTDVGAGYHQNGNEGRLLSIGGWTGLCRYRLSQVGRVDFTLTFDSSPIKGEGV